VKSKEILKGLGGYVELKKLVGNILDAPGMGGNISVKLDDGSMLIKASGQDMKQHKNLVAYLPENDTFSVTDDFDFSWSAESKKPSMEWKMHKAIPAKYVLHYHPIYAMPLLCATDYEIGSNNLPYLNPGKELADGITELVGDKTEFSGIINLRNHGIVIASDCIIDVRRKYLDVKNHLMDSSIDTFTPDDVVDSTNPDLWLFNKVLKQLASEQDVKLRHMTKKDKHVLTNDVNEKYRLAQKE
jgi:L-fuculose-phosphate aldolase